MSGEPAYLKPLWVVLVRHGVTDMTVEHAFSGSGVPGPSLNAAGRVQAAKAADAIHGIGSRSWPQLAKASEIVASPMVRTQETAAAIGRRIGAAVATDDDLREIHFGSWEGITSAEIAKRDGDAIHRWRRGQIAAPGGEDMATVGRRMDAVLRRLASAHAEHAADADEPRTVVAVSHAVSIKCAVGDALGARLEQWGAIWPEPASLTILQLRVLPDGGIGERHVLCVGAPTH